MAHLPSTAALLVQNTFFANASVVQMLGNTTIAANTTATANCNVFNFACGSLLIQPINGTIVNTAITMNAFTTFLGQASFFANVTFNAQIFETGNTLINGVLTVNAGSVLTRQVLYGQTGHRGCRHVDQSGIRRLRSGRYSGLHVPEPDPEHRHGADGHSGSHLGGNPWAHSRHSEPQHHVQLTMASANTSSGANNRFKFPGDLAVTDATGRTCGTRLQHGDPSMAVDLAIEQPDSGPHGARQHQHQRQAGCHQHRIAWQHHHQWLAERRQFVAGGRHLDLTGNTDMAGYANVGLTLQVAGVSTLTGNASLGGFANVSGTLQVGGNTTLNGTRCFANGQLRCDTTNGRLVLPVGTNLWAT
jgi:hypothetical protein